MPTRTKRLLREELRGIHAGKALGLALPEGIPGALEAWVTVLAADRVDFDLFVPAAHCDDAPASHGFLACGPSQFFAWNFA